MKNPLNQKVTIKHSESKTAWNIIGTRLGDRYKIARIPYHQLTDDGEYKEEYNTREKAKALEIAQFIRNSFNT